METMQLTLHKSSIEDLREYKSILQENAKLLGMKFDTRDEPLEALVSFAIMQALNMEKKENAEIRKIRGGN